MNQPAEIIKTLAFFDLFGIPLTGAEIYRHGSGVDLAQTQAALSDLVAAGKLKRHEAFYFLPDREPNMVSDYKLRQAQSFEMIRSAQPWLARLAAWPSVRGLAICNSLSFLNAHPNSDVDVFVLVEPKKLWSTRFVLVSLLHLFGKRPTVTDQAGKICLSFFLNAQNPDVAGMALPADDIYLSYWTKFLMPMHDAGGVFDHFYKTNGALLSGARPLIKTLRKTGPNKGFARLFSPFAKLADHQQSRIKHWQEQRFPHQIKTMAGRGTGVIISDDVLKFHTQDRRAEYRDAWLKRCAQFSV